MEHDRLGDLSPESSESEWAVFSVCVQGGCFKVVVYMQYIPKPVIWQPDVSQGNNNTDFDRTSATSLLVIWQLTRQTYYLNNIFIKSKYNVDYVRWNTLGNTNSNTLSNVDSGPVTTATYRTSEAHLNLSHVYHNLTTYALRTNQ